MEEIKYKIRESEYDALIAKLQAESQRADKAEEMVAALSNQLRPYLPNCNCTDPAYDEYPCDYCDSGYTDKHTEAHLVIKAFRQKLCDEIVGKIEVKASVLGKTSRFVTAFGLSEAIDIVKSVLIDEE